MGTTVKKPRIQNGSGSCHIMLNTMSPVITNTGSKDILAPTSFEKSLNATNYSHAKARPTMGMRRARAFLLGLM
jgi:hypothetical protein